MKIGLISDIHADYEAVCEVLERLEQFHQVDEILCLGDLTGYGDEPVKVLNLLRERQFKTVRGNHDTPSDATSAENAEYLRSLPMEMLVSYGDCKIYLCHGTPMANYVGFTARLLERAVIREMVDALNVAIVIAGHTHQVMCLRVNQTWILNPGSVYSQSEEGTSHSYGVLDLDDNKLRIFDLRLDRQASPIEIYSLQ